MSLTAAFVVHEACTQWRSLRFRVLSILYIALGASPAVLIQILGDDPRITIGAATYAKEVTGFLPLLTGLFALLIATDGISREREGGGWTTVTLSGMSSAGYLLRRWLALELVILPVTALPLLLAAILAASSGLSVTPAPFAGPWLLAIAPLALAFSTLGLALGTIAGGGMQAFLLLGTALWALPALADLLLFKLRLQLGSPLAALQWREWERGIERVRLAFDPNFRWGRPFPTPASEAGFDFGTAGEQYLSRLLPALLLAAAALGLATLYLRRTRPDLRPWRIRRDHPLRTLLRLVGRLREGAVPDPAPSRADLSAVALLLVAAMALLVFRLDRTRRYEDLARQRYEAESVGWPPASTPVDVVPGRWRLEGRIGPGDGVSVRVTAEVLNRGPLPRRDLMFQLNPELRVESATADRGSLRLERRWDRLAVRLDPPLPPGGRRELRLQLSGRPSSPFFSLAWSHSPSGEEKSFLQPFRWHREARFAHDFSNFAYSYRVPAVSPLRVELTAADLGPVLRYQSWTLVQGVIPRESFRPLADVEIALATEPGLFLADSCGGVARPAGGLASRCRTPLETIEVAGGPQRILRPEHGTATGATVAVFPTHVRMGRLHLGFLAEGARLIDEAWPGLGELYRPVVLEWPSPLVHDLTFGTVIEPFFGPRNEIAVRGGLVFVSESALILSRPFEPEGFAAGVVAARLSQQRSVVPADAYFFSRLFQALALQRLGLGPEGGAVVGPVRTGLEDLLRIPPPTEPWAELYWEVRFPALVAALEHRMGSETLRQAIDELVCRPGGRPAGRQELYEVLARHGGPSAERMIQDFLVQGALPEPVLLDVSFRRTAGGWQATGRVENHGDGLADCKVVLATDLAPAETRVQVEGGRAAVFTLATPHRPQAVLLDPDRECHRLLRNVGTPDRAYFTGEAR